MTNLVGRVLLNRYRVDAELGRGGMAEVYRVWDTQRSTHLALKLMRDDLAEDAIFLRRFRREAGVLETLQHPNIVRFYGLGQDGGLTFMLMDYIDGSTLRKEIFTYKQPLPSERIQKILRPVCAALHYAHQNGVVHCDVKPGNIMLHRNGTVLVADFGIARLTEGATTTTMVGAGTPAYMAPEQIRGEAPTPATDVYALGVVLYEMLSGGERPFTGEQARISGTTMEKVRWEHLFLEPPPLSQHNPEIAPAMESVVMRCLDKDPSLRHQGAIELSRAFEDVLLAPAAAAASGNRAAPASRVEKAARPQASHLRRPRRQLWLGLGVVILFALLLGGALMALARPGTISPTQPARALSASATFAGQAAPNRPTSTAPPAGTATIIPASTPAPETAPALDPPPTADRRVETPAAINPDNAIRLKVLGRFGNGILSAIAWSGNGKYLAAASSTGVYIYDVHTLEMLRSIETQPYINSVAFSPDGETLAAAGPTERLIHLWQISDGGLVQTLEGHTRRGGVGHIVISPDGKSIASVGESDHIIHVQQIADGKLLAIMEGHTDKVTGLAFSPDGSILVSASDDSNIRVWQAGNGKLLHTLKGHTGAVGGAAFSPDGEILASAGYADKTFRLWRVSDGRLVFTQQMTRQVLSVAFSSDGDTLAVALDDGSVQLWRVKDRSMKSTLQGHPLSVHGLSFSPAEDVLASASEDGTIRLWQASDGATLGILDGFSARTSSVAFSPDGRLLASSQADNTVRLWRVSDKALLHTLSGHADDVQVAVFSPGSGLVASGSSDNTIRLWRVSDGSLVHTLEGHFGIVTSLAFSPDGETLVSGATDGAIRFWNVSTGAQLKALIANPNYGEMVLSPDGNTLAYPSGLYSMIGAVHMQPISDSSPRLTLKGHTNWAKCVAFSPDGKVLASGSRDHTIRLWQVSDGSLIDTLEGHTTQVSDLAFSPDGSILASVSDDGTLRLWGVADGSLLLSLDASIPEYEGWNGQLDFSPDGSLLASGAIDGAIRLWGVEP